MNYDEPRFNDAQRDPGIFAPPDLPIKSPDELILLGQAAARAKTPEAIVAYNMLFDSYSGNELTANWFSDPAYNGQLQKLPLISEVGISWGGPNLMRGHDPGYGAVPILSQDPATLPAGMGLDPKTQAAMAPKPLPPNVVPMRELRPGSEEVSDAAHAYLLPTGRGGGAPRLKDGHAPVVLLTVRPDGTYGFAPKIPEDFAAAFALGPPVGNPEKYLQNLSTDVAVDFLHAPDEDLAKIPGAPALKAALQAKQQGWYVHSQKVYYLADVDKESHDYFAHLPKASRGSIVMGRTGVDPQGIINDDGHVTMFTGDVENDYHMARLYENVSHSLGVVNTWIKGKYGDMLPPDPSHELRKRALQRGTNIPILPAHISGYRAILHQYREENPGFATAEEINSLPDSAIRSMIEEPARLYRNFQILGREQRVGAVYEMAATIPLGMSLEANLLKTLRIAGLAAKSINATQKIAQVALESSAMSAGWATADQLFAVDGERLERFKSMAVMAGGADAGLKLAGLGLRASRMFAWTESTEAGIKRYIESSPHFSAMPADVREVLVDRAMTDHVRSQFVLNGKGAAQSAAVDANQALMRELGLETPLQELQRMRQTLEGVDTDISNLHAAIAQGTPSFIAETGSLAAVQGLAANPLPKLKPRPVTGFGRFVAELEHAPVGKKISSGFSRAYETLTGRTFDGDIRSLSEAARREGVKTDDMIARFTRLRDDIQVTMDATQAEYEQLLSRYTAGKEAAAARLTQINAADPRVRRAVTLDVRVQESLEMLRRDRELAEVLSPETYMHLRTMDAADRSVLELTRQLGERQELLTRAETNLGKIGNPTEAQVSRVTGLRSQVTDLQTRLTQAGKTRETVLAEAEAAGVTGLQTAERQAASRISASEARLAKVREGVPAQIRVQEKVIADAATAKESAAKVRAQVKAEVGKAQEKRLRAQAKLTDLQAASAEREARIRQLEKTAARGKVAAEQLAKKSPGRGRTMESLAKEVQAGEDAAEMRATVEKRFAADAQEILRVQGIIDGESARIKSLGERAARFEAKASEGAAAAEKAAARKAELEAGDFAPGWMDERQRELLNEGVKASLERDAMETQARVAGVTRDAMWRGANRQGRKLMEDLAAQRAVTLEEYRAAYASAKENLDGIMLKKLGGVLDDLTHGEVHLDDELAQLGARLRSAPDKPGWLSLDKTPLTKDHAEFKRAQGLSAQLKRYAGVATEEGLGTATPMSFRALAREVLGRPVKALTDLQAFEAAALNDYLEKTVLPPLKSKATRMKQSLRVSLINTVTDGVFAPFFTPATKEGLTFEIAPGMEEAFSAKLRELERAAGFPENILTLADIKSIYGRDMKEGLHNLYAASSTPRKRIETIEGFFKSEVTGHAVYDLFEDAIEESFVAETIGKLKAETLEEKRQVLMKIYQRGVSRKGRGGVWLGIEWSPNLDAVDHGLGYFGLNSSNYVTAARMGRERFHALHRENVIHMATYASGAKKVENAAWRAYESTGHRGAETVLSPDDLQGFQNPLRRDRNVGREFKAKLRELAGRNLDADFVETVNEAEAQRRRALVHEEARRYGIDMTHVRALSDETDRFFRDMYEKARARHPEMGKIEKGYFPILHTSGPTDASYNFKRWPDLVEEFYKHERAKAPASDRIYDTTQAVELYYATFLESEGHNLAIQEYRALRNRAAAIVGRNHPMITQLDNSMQRVLMKSKVQHMPDWERWILSHVQTGDMLRLPTVGGVARNSLDPLNGLAALAGPGGIYHVGKSGLKVSKNPLWGGGVGGRVSTKGRALWEQHYETLRLNGWANSDYIAPGRAEMLADMVKKDGTLPATSPAHAAMYLYEWADIDSRVVAMQFGADQVEKAMKIAGGRTLAEFEVFAERARINGAFPNGTYQRIKTHFLKGGSLRQLQDDVGLAFQNAGLIDYGPGGGVEALANPRTRTILTYGSYPAARANLFARSYEAAFGKNRVQPRSFKPLLGLAMLEPVGWGSSLLFGGHPRAALFGISPVFMDLYKRFAEGNAGGNSPVQQYGTLGSPTAIMAMTAGVSLAAGMVLMWDATAASPDGQGKRTQEFMLKWSPFDNYRRIEDSDQGAEVLRKDHNKLAAAVGDRAAWLAMEAVKSHWITASIATEIDIITNPQEYDTKSGEVFNKVVRSVMGMNWKPGDPPGSDDEIAYPGPKMSFGVSASWLPGEEPDTQSEAYTQAFMGSFYRRQKNMGAWSGLLYLNARALGERNLLGMTEEEVNRSEGRGITQLVYPTESDWQEKR